MEFLFDGTGVELYVCGWSKDYPLGFAACEAELFLDGKSLGTYRFSGHQMQRRLFFTDGLAKGRHTLKAVCKGKHCLSTICVTNREHKQTINRDPAFFDGLIADANTRPVGFVPTGRKKVFFIHTEAPIAPLWRALGNADLGIICIFRRSI